MLQKHFERAFFRIASANFVKNLFSLYIIQHNLKKNLSLS